MDLIDSLAMKCGLEDFPAPRQLGRQLKQACFASSPGEYASFSAMASAGACFLAAAAAAITGAEPTAAAAASIATAAVCATLLFTHPGRAAASKASVMEAELPTALKLVAIELESGNNFQGALSAAAGGDDALSSEVRQVLCENASGTPMPRALREMARRADSLQVKRACGQLVSQYEHGGSAAALSKLADEALSVQIARAREFNSKLAFAGVVFVSISAVVPALFAAYALVGSYFLETTISPGQVYAAFLLGFPLADAAVIAFLLQGAPGGRK